MNCDCGLQVNQLWNCDYGDGGDGDDVDHRGVDTYYHGVSDEVHGKLRGYVPCRSH